MPSLPTSTDVFVIGGGPAGLAAAIAARQCGFEVTLADAAIPPIDKACGEGIMPDGLTAARALGIDLESAEGQAFRGIRFCDSVRSVEAAFPQGIGIGMRRIALHHIMADRAAAVGVRLAWGVRVEGIGDDCVRADGETVRARWIIGADGGRSRVRRWAGLDASKRDTLRFGFRRHYAIAPWSEFTEIHWAVPAQLYITPVSASEICVALISRDPHLRLDDALPLFPAAARRLRSANPAGFERGGVSASRRLNAVARGRVALVGDASGSVDAIAGEGLCLLFQQSAALAGAIERGDLSLYRTAHSQLMRRPAFMANLMLTLDGRGWLQRFAMRGMTFQPRLFELLLAAHVGAGAA
jgi:flavin-dependent dehydrogenase